LLWRDSGAGRNNSHGQATDEIEVLGPWELGARIKKEAFSRVSANLV